MAMIGVWRPKGNSAWRMRAVAWKPSISGIWRSIRMRSKLWAAAASTAQSVAGHQEGVAHLPDGVLGEFLVDDVILGQQDAQRCGRGGGGRFRRLFFGGLWGLVFAPIEAGGEVKGAAAAGSALHPDSPLHQLDEFGADGKPETGTALAAGGPIGLSE